MEVSNALNAMNPRLQRVEGWYPHDYVYPIGFALLGVCLLRFCFPK